MASNTKVFNQSTRQYLKRSQARNRVEQGLSIWIKEGFVIRNCSLAETITIRSEMSRLQEPLPSIEIPGLIYEPSDRAAFHKETVLAREAHKFLTTMIQ